LYFACERNGKIYTDVESERKTKIAMDAVLGQQQNSICQIQHCTRTHFPEGRMVTPRPMADASSCLPLFVSSSSSLILAAVFFRSAFGVGFLRGFFVADTGVPFVSALPTALLLFLEVAFIICDLSFLLLLLERLTTDRVFNELSGISMILFRS
jgi:hypothetical protein